MSEAQPPDWDPRAKSVLEDQLAAYDQMRHHCPVACSEYLHWSLFRHADVKRALEESDLFSNAVSRQLSVPNGTDPPQHTEYRRIIDPYFSSERMDAFAPVCRTVVGSLIAGLPADAEIEFTAAFADIFAIQVTCAFLDWPADSHEPLLQWIRRNHAATLAGDRTLMAAVAVEFDGYIRDWLSRAGADGGDDVASRLLREQVGGRRLREAEIVSILRNWTVGELGTISACIGILVHFLARLPRIQQQLRAQPHLLPAAIDEILRSHAPLISSRRITTRAMSIGGRRLQAGERLTLMWASANRDEAVFGDPDEFRLDRDPRMNLLYGAGIHVCPGAPLARLELRIVMEELLGATREIALVPGVEPVGAVYPASGFSVLPLSIHLRALTPL
jgi:cytochrome P450